MKKFKVAALMLLMLMWKTEVDAEVIKCQFSSITDTDLGSLYYCNVTNTNVLLGDKVKIEAPIEAHLPGKTNENVNFLLINSAIGLTKFPTNINGIFLGLRGVNFAGCGLTDITQNDLKVLPNLISLNLNQNKLRIIRADTFKANSNLEHIFLYFNSIIHIDQFTFISLNNLKSLHLSSNYCPSLTDAKTTNKIESLKQQIDNGICQSIEYTGPALIAKFEAELKKLMDEVDQFQIKADTCEEQINESIESSNNVHREISKVTSAVSRYERQKTFWDKVGKFLPIN